MLGSWFANLLRISRTKCVLFTNSRTLYSFLAPGVRKGDIAEFKRIFVENLLQNLRAEGIGGQLTRAIEADGGRVAIAKTNSRSVLGSMNDLAYQLEVQAQMRGGLSRCDVMELNRMLNRVPMSTIGYRFAVDRIQDVVARL